jgi:hypothetical protein
MTSGIQYEVRSAVIDQPFISAYSDYTMAVSKVRELRVRHPDAEVRLFRRQVPPWKEVSVE